MQPEDSLLPAWKRRTEVLAKVIRTRVKESVKRYEEVLGKYAARSCVACAEAFLDQRHGKKWTSVATTQQLFPTKEKRVQILCIGSG